ncbi:hypothetical protein GCM10009798_07790 [Nocardioides panacihumi]|uniref:Uncharacterized protein n=1 Tax=Nocardioides panacihumi TaxID=400774 RepID=A0ABP5BQW8_9ACTN
MGFGLPDGPWYGFLVVALVTAGMCAAVGGVLYEPQLARGLRRLARRISPPPEAPADMPIERIARNARRLRAEMATLSSGTPAARRESIARAYDDLLVEACRALDVPDTLSGMPPGAERDSERLHVEFELEAVGLRLSA